jgi:uncharacterized membrane protein YkgB
LLLPDHQCEARPLPGVLVVVGMLLPDAGQPEDASVMSTTFTLRSFLLTTPTSTASAERRAGRCRAEKILEGQKCPFNYKVHVF